MPAGADTLSQNIIKQMFILNLAFFQSNNRTDNQVNE